ncbi:MAG: sporulation protein YunB [Peptococcaceae bacterium]|nr:sporulation protein YunB [Peptococcaceae bacterium]
MLRRHRLYFGPARPRFFSRPMKRRPRAETETKRLRKKTVALSAALLIVWLTYYTVVFIKEQIQPPIRQMAALAAHQMAAEVINKTLYQEILPGVSYDQLVSVHQDGAGQLSYLQTDTAALGELVSSTGLAIKENLKELEKEEIKIPLGMISGFYLFSHLGPELTVPLNPMGTVDVNISDSFSQAGINQVKHTIYMEVKTEVQIVIPFMADVEEVELRLPIADSVIIGQVPEIYLGSGSAQNSAVQ